VDTQKNLVEPTTTTMPNRRSSAYEPSLLPPKGRTFLTIGQDLFSVEAYVRDQYNYTLHQLVPNGTVAKEKNKSRTKWRIDPRQLLSRVVPAGAMTYTDIQLLRGLDIPADYGSGIEYADGTVESLLRDKGASGGGVALQVGLWLNGTEGCRDIVDGKLDDNIDRLFDYLLLQCRADRIYLRVGYEFDNPDFGYADDPATYRHAYRALVDACRRGGTNRRRRLCRPGGRDGGKIEFVWHSWAAGLPAQSTTKTNMTEDDDDHNTTTTNGTATSNETIRLSYEDFYPGNDYVDWMGISLFSQFYPAAAKPLGTRETVVEAIQFAQSRNNNDDENRRKYLPIMIAESTPFWGINRLEDPWNDWFEPVLDLIDEYDIAMWSYINCDWDAQPMWRGVGFGDTRLSINKTVLELWRKRVVDNPRFLNSLRSEGERVSRRRGEKGILRLDYFISGGSSMVSEHVMTLEYWIPVTAVVLVILCFRYYCYPVRCRWWGCSKQDATSSSSSLEHSPCPKKQCDEGRATNDRSHPKNTDYGAIVT